MSGAYAVLVVEVPTEPTPGDIRKIRIQIGIDWGEVDLVNLWLDRLERHRIITPVRLREWVVQPDDPSDEDDGDEDDGVDDDPNRPQVDDNGPGELELQLRDVRARRWSRKMEAMQLRAETAEAKLLELEK